MEQAREPWDSGQLVYSLIDLDKAVAEADRAYRAYRMVARETYLPDAQA
ncbi:hypothetical protein H6CHR_00795 [Variovorax sp. PBL-H6]|nr:hypothetical protein H6CHR_00795 [Variovorax sp. PBL-H6]